MNDVLTADFEVIHEPKDSIEVIKDFGSYLQCDFRERIFEVEKLIIATPGSIIGDCDECPLKHSFANGICVREIFLPRHSLLTGRIHKCDHPNFIMSGDVSVVTEFEGIQRLKAPASMISKAGTKRLVYCHSDTWWITIHRTDETDVDKIRDEITVSSYEEFEHLVRTK